MIWPSIPITSHAILYPGRAQDVAERIVQWIGSVAAVAPFRHMKTPRGLTVKAAMTNCGEVGWISDRTGYRYSAIDPLTGLPWPAIHPSLMTLAAQVASDAGYAGFVPDVCLINRYDVGSGMGAHRDEDEQDFGAPIVSISLGLPARFFFGGLERGGPTMAVPLAHGDVLVWGGPDRLRYHGVRPLKPGRHPLTDSFRFNLTFRKALSM
jgi:DNA oxidative demethylase